MKKFADLNAGTVLLLYRINEIWPSPELKQAADKTLQYLTTTLFDEQSGAFMSFQIADEVYYFLQQEDRQKRGRPKIMDKVFADRLAATLNYLLDVTDYVNDPALSEKLMRSIDFLGQMVMGSADLSRYYLSPKGVWQGRAGLSDYAHIGSLFARAAVRLGNPQYTSVAVKAVRDAVAEFYDEQQQAFLDPSVDTASSAEYLMEMNGLLVQTMMQLGAALESDQHKLVRPVLTYFSLMGDVLEDRFWDGVEWEFAETYVPYLSAAERYLATQVTSQ